MKGTHEKWKEARDAQRARFAAESAEKARLENETRRLMARGYCRIVALSLAAHPGQLANVDLLAA